MHVLLVGGSVRFGLTCPSLAWDLSSKALSAPFFIKWPPPSSFLSLAFKGAVAAILITLSETSVGVPFALESSVPVGGLAGGGGGGEGDGIGEGGGGEGEGEIGGNGGDEGGGGDEEEAEKARKAIVELTYFEKIRKEIIERL